MSRTIRIHVFTSKLFISGNTTISLSGLLPSVLAPTASLTGTSSLPLASYCVRVTGGRCPSSLYLFIALSVSLPLLSFPEATSLPRPTSVPFVPRHILPLSLSHPLGCTLYSIVTSEGQPSLPFLTDLESCIPAPATESDGSSFRPWVITQTVQTVQDPTSRSPQAAAYGSGKPQIPVACLECPRFSRTCISFVCLLCLRRTLQGATYLPRLYT